MGEFFPRNVLSHTLNIPAIMEFYFIPMFNLGMKHDAGGKFKYSVLEIYTFIIIVGDHESCS